MRKHPEAWPNNKESDMATIPNQRACNNCKQIFPVTADYWQAITNSSDGFRKTCLTCKSKKDRQRYEANKKETIARAKEWYLANKEVKQKYDSGYRVENRERRRENNRKNYHRVRQTLPQRYKAKTLTFQTKRFKQSYKFIAKDFTRLLDRQRYRCYYCEERFTNLLDMEVEHVMPAARGGNNSKGNIVLACRICNRAKSVRTVMEFRLNKVRYNRLPQHRLNKS